METPDFRMRRTGRDFILGCPRQAPIWRTELGKGTGNWSYFPNFTGLLDPWEEPGALQTIPTKW